MKPEQIMPASKIEAAFKGTNFGSLTPLQVVKETLLKIACGYATGNTALYICQELKLIIKGRYELTEKGKKYLYHSCIN